jgi:hypothetical protein
MTKAIHKTAAKRTTCQGPKCRLAPVGKSTYCSPACRKAASRKSTPKPPRPVKTAMDYMAGPFWDKLCDHLGRTGTVEASPYNDGEYLALSQLDKACGAFNGDMGRTFELSHIVPASKGGFFNLQNLVIAPVTMNRLHGSNHFGFGEAVDMDNADPRYLITATTSRPIIKQLLIDLHGEAFMLKEAKAVKPVKSTRKADLVKVLMLFNPCNSTHEELLKSVEFINGLTGRQLKSALDIVTGDSTAPIYFAPAASTASVFVSELDRMAKYRPEFAKVSDGLSKALTTQKHCPSAFTTEHATILFNLLHGRTLVQSVVDKLVLENTIEMRVRWSAGFDFHIIKDHHDYWLNNKAESVSFVSQWTIAQDVAADQYSPF